MKSGERRAAIVEAAIHLFAEKGFRGATTRELATSLGVTEPILYQHFETKNEIYNAILESKSQEGDQWMTEWLPLIESNDDRKFFGIIAGLVLSRYEEDPDFMRLLLFSALERHELADLFYERQMQVYFNAVSKYIQHRIESGAFRSVDPDAAARGFTGMVGYHGLLHLLFRNRIGPIDQPKLVSEMVETFLCGVQRSPEISEQP